MRSCSGGGREGVCAQLLRVAGAASPSSSSSSSRSTYSRGAACEEGGKEGHIDDVDREEPRWCGDAAVSS